MEIKQEYERLKLKYNLPDYEELNREFELLYIQPIQEISFPMRFIRRRVSDRLVWVCNMIQTMLNPNPSSFINLQESKFFDAKDREKMTLLLKEFMQLERQTLILDFLGDEEKDAQLIKEIYKVWIKNKKEIINLAEKLKEGWKQETKQEKNHYFG